MDAEIVRVTPELAAEWLSRNTRPSQRPLGAWHVAALAETMAAGDWQVTHQGIAFDEQGRLADGQHRLAAIIKAGVTVDMQVTRGLSDAQILALDLVRKRAAGYVLHMPEKVVALVRAMAKSLPVTAAERAVVANVAYVGRLAERHVATVNTLHEWGMVNKRGGTCTAYVAAQFGKALAAGVDASKLAPIARALVTPSDGQFPAINLLRLFIASRRAANAEGRHAVDVALKTQRAIQASLDGDALSRLYAPAQAIYPPISLEVPNA